MPCFILFLQYLEVGIFILLQKYSHETQIIQHVTHIGLTLTWSGLYTTQEREFWDSFSGKKSKIF